MIETTTEVCKICGKEYRDSHIVPRAPYAPYLCDTCEEHINAYCGGSWISAVYLATYQAVDKRVF